MSAARAVSVPHPLGVARWGTQIDAQVLDRSAGRRAQQVAGYVAKYATKSSDGDGALDAPIRSEEDLARRTLPPHLRRMAETAWALGADPAFEPYNLRRHAHGLGFGGHFLSKSQGYSTSFSALKAARADWREGTRQDGDGEAGGGPFSRAPSAGGRCRLGQPGGSPLGGLPATATARGAEGRQRGVVQPDGAGYGAMRSVVRRP